jgi:UDP-N-acetylmuramoyl-tripeptide--D-alanyl-D-alanine ligase
MTFGDWLKVLGITLGMVLAMRSLVHYFQLESYQFPGYYRTLKRNAKRAILPGFLLGCTAGVMNTMRMMLGKNTISSAIYAAVVVCIGELIGRLMRDSKAKKPLNVTPRVKRLYAVSTVVFALISWGVAATLGSIWLWVLPVLLPAMVALGGLCAWPIEKLISELYFRDAQKKLKERPDLIKIGITGSYGKTSVKFILGTLLSEKYQTLVTPSSFNTPMGVTKVIRTKLQPAHQVFVAEMGARHVGDIKEMCRLVHPTYGVLTSVGPQHLDTFKTIDRIKKTKYELMDAIPEGGCCFFPNDGAICTELYMATTKEKRLCSMQADERADVWAEDIRVSPEGSSFLLCTKDGKTPCTTKTLGEHNIQNILLAATVCFHLGMNAKQIARGIAKVEPVEHRLQILPNRGGMTVIDDAFNSNPKGSAAALRVLAAFPGRRIIITPGMVELGSGEEEYNRDFGRQMAESTDIAILVGKRHTEPIVQGLQEKNFLRENIHVVNSLAEATTLLNQIGQSGDVVLFENDLPDNYSEQ